MNLQEVVSNREALEAAGAFEREVVQAYLAAIATDPDEFAEVIETCDRVRLRDAGDPLPFEWSFPLGVFRGVSGEGKERRERGWSWSTSLSVACDFAVNSGRPNPTVYVAEVPTINDPFAFLGGMCEREVLWRPDVGAFWRLDIDEATMRRMAQHYRDKLIPQDEEF